MTIQPPWYHDQQNCSTNEETKRIPSNSWPWLETINRHIIFYTFETVLNWKVQIVPLFPLTQIHFGRLYNGSSAKTNAKKMRNSSGKPQASAMILRTKACDQEVSNKGVALDPHTPQCILIEK